MRSVPIFNNRNLYENKFQLLSMMTINDDNLDIRI